jgi:hypothetical protein
MYPKIYSKNYLTKDCVVTVTSGDTLKAYLYDQLKTPQWISSGETAESGNYTCQITINFMADSYSPYSVNRTFDTLILINTNIKKFKLQYWNGSSFVNINETITTNNSADFIIVDFSSAPVSSEKVRLCMDSTIVAGQEKKIGELWIVDYKFTLSNLLIGHDRKDWIKEGQYRLANGTLETWQEISKFTLNQSLRNVEKALRDNLKDLKEEYDNFTIYPNGDEWDDELFLVYWRNVWTENYNPKTTLYTILFNIEEK